MHTFIHRNLHHCLFASNCLLKINGRANLTIPIRFVQIPNNLSSAPSLTENRVLEFISTLNVEERKILIETVKKIDSEEIKINFQGTAATSFRWRSEFGRPSKLTKVTVDEVVNRKTDEVIQKPSRNELCRLAFYNSVPFIGFGFLDNTIMILGGDSIELMVGSVITISTMMAAALGNTLSDIISIGSAFYVEQFVAKLGVKKPSLTHAQMSLSCSRRAANMGRTLGVTVGCILGMFPLLFK